jgi:hypothetical protein
MADHEVDGRRWQLLAIRTFISVAVKGRVGSLANAFTEVYNWRM